MPPTFTLVSSWACSSAQKMKAICSSETSVGFQRTTRRYIPEDRSLHKHRCGNLSLITLFRPPTLYKYLVEMLRTWGRTVGVSAIHVQYSLSKECMALQQLTVPPHSAEGFSLSHWLAPSSKLTPTQSLTSVHVNKIGGELSCNRRRPKTGIDWFVFLFPFLSFSFCSSSFCGLGTLTRSDLFPFRIDLRNRRY
jgi:hypothetical protein